MNTDRDWNKDRLFYITFKYLYHVVFEISRLQIAESSTGHERNGIDDITGFLSQWFCPILEVSVDAMIVFTATMMAREMLDRAMGTGWSNSKGILTCLSAGISLFYTILYNFFLEVVIVLIAYGIVVLVMRNIIYYGDDDGEWIGRGFFYFPGIKEKNYRKEIKLSLDI